MTIRIGAAFNDPADFGTKAPDGRPGRICGLAILDGVVEKGGNRLVFGRAVFESDGARAEQVAQVRDLRGLAFLPTVNLCRGGHRVDDPLAVEPGLRRERPPAPVDVVLHADVLYETRGRW